MTLTPMTSHVTYIRLDLPPTAQFCHLERGWVPYEYGPCQRSDMAFDAEYTSQQFVVAGDIETGTYTLVGALTCRRSVTNLTVHRVSGVFRGVTVAQPEIRRGEEPEAIITLTGTDWRGLLEEYGRLVADRMDVKVPDTSRNATGYCSWYYYYHNVTETQFLENLDALVAFRGDFPAQYVQIDDGYQAHHGDWLERHPNWPTPLAETVAKVNALGLTAGIWTMPFLASTGSRVFREHPDWLVCDDLSGRPVTVAGWSPEPDRFWVVLDATHPAVKDYLRTVFSTLYDWGFRYFKLDGLGFSTPLGRRQDSRATAISAYRDGLTAIRECVKDSLVLICGPNFPALGLGDHARVSADTSNVWERHGLPTEGAAAADASEPVPPAMPGLKNALCYSLAHWWQYDVWYRADPDVVIARDETTQLTVGEARMSVLLSMLTGVVFTSDHLGKMVADRRCWLGLAARTRMRNIRPEDWRQRAFPHVYSGTVEGKRAVAIFNFSDQANTYDLGTYGLAGEVRDLLRSQEPIARHMLVAAHDAALLVSG